MDCFASLAMTWIRLRNPAALAPVEPGWDSNSLRQLDTSHGCQNHTALPYASAPLVCTLCSKEAAYLD
jgi:hypothetical protein